MPKAKARPVKGSQAPTFDVEAFLESVGAARRLVAFPKGKVVFAQGEPSDAVMYIQKGGVRISVLSRSGKEAVVAMLGPGDFFGEGALTGQPVRIGTATATTHATVLMIEKGAMLRLLHEEPAFSDAFISFMLSRNIRIEADLVDQLFNSSEKRLARACGCPVWNCAVWNTARSLRVDTLIRAQEQLNEGDRGAEQQRQRPNESGGDQEIVCHFPGTPEPGVVHGGTG